LGTPVSAGVSSRSQSHCMTAPPAPNSVRSTVTAADEPGGVVLTVVADATHAAWHCDACAPPEHSMAAVGRMISRITDGSPPPRVGTDVTASPCHVAGTGATTDGQLYVWPGFHVKGRLSACDSGSVASSHRDGAVEFNRKAAVTVPFAFLVTRPHQ
jgi:hypothetical protein